MENEQLVLYFIVTACARIIELLFYKKKSFAVSTLKHNKYDTSDLLIFCV